MDTKKCIWMDAGAVAYQLCPLKQNCELCDFHKEMVRGCRTHSIARKASLVTMKVPEESVIHFVPGLQYLPGHFWYRRIADGKIRIGIDKFLWQLFSAAQKVVTPEDKTTLRANQCFAWLLLGGGIIYLRTPIPGRILGSNPLFLNQDIEDAHLYLSPEPELWLLELEVSDLSGFENLTREKYINQTQHDYRRFKALKSPENLRSQAPIFPGAAEITRNEFSKYLRAISDNQIYIC